MLSLLLSLWPFFVSSCFICSADRCLDERKNYLESRRVVTNSVPYFSFIVTLQVGRLLSPVTHQIYFRLTVFAAKNLKNICIRPTKLHASLFSKAPREVIRFCSRRSWAVMRINNRQKYSYTFIIPTILVLSVSFLLLEHPYQTIFREFGQYWKQYQAITI